VKIRHQLLQLKLLTSS